MVLGHEESEELNQDEDVIKTLSTLEGEDGTPHRTHDKNGRRISNIPDLVEKRFGYYPEKRSQSLAPGFGGDFGDYIG
jgi:hypothetical protein